MEHPTSLFLCCLAVTAFAVHQQPDAATTDQRVFVERLRTLASQGGGHAIDCGIAPASHREEIASCGQKAFEDHRPFFLGYSTQSGQVFFGYGLATDGNGSVFAVSYDPRGYPAVVLNRHMHLADENHTRISDCIKPVMLTKTGQGLLACVAPINGEESEKASRQKPVETSVCAVLNDPPAFNNKLVRVRGYYSGDFENSTLSGDGCTGSIWFGYAGGGGPPSLAAYVSTGNTPWAEDADGKRILPVPVTLLRDAHLERFEKAVQIVSMNHEVVPLIGATPEPRFVTATFIGRIDTVSAEVHEFLKRQVPEHRSNWLGYGQMGAFEAQFTLQSVEDDATVQ